MADNHNCIVFVLDCGLFRIPRYISVHQRQIHTPLVIICNSDAYALCLHQYAAAQSSTRNLQTTFVNNSSWIRLPEQKDESMTPPRRVVVVGGSTVSTFLPAGRVKEHWRTVWMESNISRHRIPDYDTACCRQSKTRYLRGKRHLKVLCFCNLDHNEAGKLSARVERVTNTWWVSLQDTSY